MSLTELPDTTAKTPARESAATVIYVCTTCRRPEDPEDYPRPGAALAEATIRAAEHSGVTVTPLRCLANCKRGCSAVLRRVDPVLACRERGISICALSPCGRGQH